MYSSIQNFRWLVFFNKSTFDELRSRMTSYCVSVPFHPVCVDGYLTPTVVQESICKLQIESEYLITSRLDNDDALSLRFVEIVQRHFARQGREFLNFSNGYVFNRGNLYRTRIRSNSFITLIERKVDFSTVLCKPHKNVAQVGPICEIENYPGWLQVIHARNLRNELRGRLVSRSKVMKYFPWLGGDVPISSFECPDFK
jgi:hypothetical protein